MLTRPLLEKNKADIDQYVEYQTIENIKLNKKEYKITMIKKIEELKHFMRRTQKFTGNKREIEDKLNELYKNVRQNIEKDFEGKEYLDIIFDEKKKEYRVAPAKVGRPTDNEKMHRVTIRFTEQEYKRLKDKADKNEQTISDIIRNSINYV